MNENNLFNHSQVNFKEFADEKWQKCNDDEFENVFSDINEPLSSQTKEKDSFKFSHSIMSLSTPSLIPPQTNSGSNKSKEDTALVEAPDFKHVNTQSEDVKPDTESAQLLSDFVKEEVDNSLTNSFALSLIISTC